MAPPPPKTDNYQTPRTEGPHENGKPEGKAGTPLPTLPIYETPYPYGNEVPLTIAIEGVVSCQTVDSKYSPIKDVVAMIRCLALNEKGYEVAPFSFSSSPTDQHGYFLATLSPSKLKGKNKVTECKVFIPNAPCEYCKYPTDIKSGVKGAMLRSFRILTNSKMKLYTVGPFFYTSEPNPYSIPDGY